MSIEDPIDNIGRWFSGYGECLDVDCCCKWSAIWPEGSDELTCPECEGTDTDRHVVEQYDKCPFLRQSPYQEH